MVEGLQERRFAIPSDTRASREAPNALYARAHGIGANIFPITLFRPRAFGRSEPVVGGRGLGKISVSSVDKLTKNWGNPFVPVRSKWRFSSKALVAIAGLTWLMLGEAGMSVLAREARAESAKDVQAGKQLAAKACSPCHNVVPLELRGASLAGPSFQEIAQGPKAAPEALTDFLRSTHNDVSHPGAMPNPELTEDQIRVISAYISSLRGQK